MIKEYLDIPQQIEHLKKQGLNCTPSANKLLDTVGYFKLINAYRKPFFETTSRHYIAGTKIQDIHELYIFDKSLRELLLSCINIIEIDIKSKMIELISDKYGVKDDEWLKAENFRPDEPTSKMKSFIDIKGHIIAEIAKQKDRHPAIKHFTKNHNYYPFWTVSSILTFGSISQIYSKLKTDDQMQISRQYSIPPSVLESILKLAVLYRNASAHNDVIYSYRANDVLAKGIKHVYEKLSIEKDDHGKYNHGINDLFALIITFKILLSSADLILFFQQFNKIMHKNRKIFNIMNLPINFNDIEKLAIK